MPIVLDSNILISAIIRDSITREIIISSNNEFLLPEYSFLEIKKHEEDTLSKARLSKEEFIELMKKLLRYIKIVKTQSILPFQKKAEKIMENIDRDDILFVACALAFKCPIWSDDRHFKIQKTIKVYNTEELTTLMSSK